MDENTHTHPLLPDKQTNHSDQIKMNVWTKVILYKKFDY